MTDFNETESLDVVFERVFNSLLCNVHTAMPAKVVSFDASNQTVSIQPSLMRKFVGQDPAPLPQIDDVPVLFPGSGEWWITVDVKPGSYVLAVFSERALESWLDRGGVVDPQISRKFDLSDAVAIPGLLPQPDKLNPGVSSDCVEVRKRDGSTSFKIEDGKVTITATDVEIDGDLTVTGDVVATEVTANGTLPVPIPTALTSHVHGGVTVGAGLTLGPEPAP